MDEGPGKQLHEALHVVHQQISLMRRCLDQDALMDALKAASTMLAELRTSVLGPKAYYELYMAVFDGLRYLSSYLLDAHQAGKQDLADLYELVQYAGNIVPRLYLMITVGAVFMSSPDAPVKEIMRDMMEMSRGVQHPTRGLFLRHYLSGMTRDHLPIGASEGPEGNLQDSIGFVLTNLIEMNKLWVRMQHQGLSRDRERRENERKELKILVGTNLVRLSQLDGVTLETYRTVILPSILEQVVNCRDVIAQEYLMEVIIQVFADDFHLRTLGPFLSATAQLHPKVNIKNIVIALIDRLAAYAAREADSDQLQQQTQNESTEGVNGDRGDVKKFRGIPTDVRLFEVFWAQVVELVKARPDLSIQDITALLVSLTNLSLSCYPTRQQYISQILHFAREKTMAFQDSPDLHHPVTANNLRNLLLAPINTYPSVLQLLSLEGYEDLLRVQSFGTRRALAHAVVHSVLKNQTVIGTPQHVDDVLRLCHVMVKDQKDAGVGMASHPGKTLRERNMEEMAEEQGWISRMVHLFRSDNLDTQFALLESARNQFLTGGPRIRYTLPPLITCTIQLARRINFNEHAIPDTGSRLESVLKFMHQMAQHLYNAVESSEVCLRLYLMALQAADDAGLEGLAYEFAVQCFTIYEESINDSKAQLQAITLIINTLHDMRVFSDDNYDTLITKAALHSAKLLKKGHQSTAVAKASHLWWQTETPGGRKANDDKPLVRDGQRVLECLQKSLRIAASCIDELTTVQLYVDALEHYVYYFEHGVPEVNAKHVNSLIDLINSQVDKVHEVEYPQAVLAGAASGLIEGVGGPESVVNHFVLILKHIRSRKQGLERDENSGPNPFDDIDITGPCLKLNVQ